MDWEVVYRDLKILNWTVLLILSAVSYFFASHSLSLGVILGGLIIIANFNVLQYTIRRAFTPGGVMIRGKASIILKYYFRLLALGVIIYFLIAKGWTDPVGLTIGLSTVVISIVIFGVHAALKTMSRETS
ncbi:MAG: ATP synthase subunit I [Desulfobacteraceae bacterium]|jgi:hypothetical protein